VAVVVAFCAAVVLVFVWHGFQHWVAVHTGIVNESGPYYGFFSGAGSDLGEITLVTGVLMAARHANCHVHGCWRFGKPVEGTPYRACWRHHPAHDQSKRNVGIGVIHEAHRLHRESATKG
jgi:hypothetical protein